MSFQSWVLDYSSLMNWLTGHSTLSSLWFYTVTKGLIINYYCWTVSEQTPCIKWTLVKVLRVSAQYRFHCIGNLFQNSVASIPSSTMSSFVAHTCTMYAVLLQTKLASKGLLINLLHHQSDHNLLKTSISTDLLEKKCWKSLWTTLSNLKV